MMLHTYTHIDSGTGRYCRILAWHLPRSTVRSPSRYDMGEDEYETETTNLELIQERPITEADIDAAFENVYAGHQYSEDAKMNAKWWFKQGFTNGTRAR